MSLCQRIHFASGARTHIVCACWLKSTALAILPMSLNCMFIVYIFELFKIHRSNAMLRECLLLVDDGNGLDRISLFLGGARVMPKTSHAQHTYTHRSHVKYTQNILILIQSKCVLDCVGRVFAAHTSIIQPNFHSINI